MEHIVLYLTVAFVAVGLAEPIHKGVRWNEVQGASWETPAGRSFPVSSHQEINALNSQLQPGDVMVMRAGEWPDARINITASGQPQSGYKIYLMPEVLGETTLTLKTQVVFTGNYIEIRGIRIEGASDDKLTPVWFEPGSSHCRFTNSLINNFNRDPHTKSHHWIEIFGSYHTIDYIALTNKMGTGQLVRVKTTNGDFKPPGAQPESWGHYIGWNYFGPRPDTGEDNGEGIQIGLFETQWVNTDTLMEFNFFDQYDAEIECISVKATNNTVRYNTLRNSNCTITLRHTDKTDIIENYVFCEGKFGCGGVRVTGEDHNIINNYIERENFDGGPRAGIVTYRGNSQVPRRKAVKNVLIERNLILDCMANCIFSGEEAVEGGDQPPEDMTYRQNVMTGISEQTWLLREYTEQVNPTFEGNVAFMGQIDNYEDYAHGIEVKDPQLVYDEEFGIWKPTNVGWEFTMTHKPLTREDVGPTWM